MDGPSLPTPKEGKLRSILMAQFHSSAGPKIICQVPSETVPKETFDALHAFIIPKPEVQNRILTIHVLGYKILGYPLSIAHDRYDRNALLFNVCFVFDAGSRTVQYEPVVKKLSEYLVTVEEEQEFLSCEQNEAALAELMNQVFTDLSTRGWCTVRINEANTVHLAVQQPRLDPLPVNSYDVPVFVGGREALVADKWDLNVQQILPFIDGFNHIATIAVEGDVDEDLVKRCVQNLLYEGIVDVIPVFQYTSTYACTPQLRGLYCDEALQRKCINYVAKSQTPCFRDVMAMYCAFVPGVTVRDVCLRHNPHALGIDERRLVQFGLLEKWIRRVDRYPICTDYTRHHRLAYHQGTLPISSQTRDTRRLLHMLADGTNSLDDICFNIKESVVELSNRIENDPSLNLIYK